jgi:bifunctional N-acetylglucosamine-1-phosphate-uridyltransferase/glucosamine-1-phosphate-acetyltransferase GlmU-like protein
MALNPIDILNKIAALEEKIAALEEKRTKKYEIVETMGVLRRDPTSYGYQFSVEELEVERLVEKVDLSPHENKRVKIIILINA